MLMQRRSRRAPGWFRRAALGLVVALAAVGGVALVPAGAPSAHAAGPDDEVAVADQILTLLNADRSAAGLQPLRRNSVLDAAAKDWNAHMIAGLCPPEHFPLCHHSRDDMAAMARAATAPTGFRWWAENVQVTYGRAEVSNLRLMASPGHRANIMRPATNLVGIGVTITPAGLMFVTQEFVEAKVLTLTSPCGPVKRTLRLGSKGPDVAVLQCALAAAGAYSGPTTVRFDAATRVAVKAFQRARGARVTGIADLATRRLLGVA